MGEPSNEVTRDELLGALRKAGARVTSAQLHRWADAGLLPRPRRRGLGRGGGKGTASLYPALAVPQAGALYEALRLRRNLDDAAWMVWVFGFPVTGYVRELLVDEWTTRERDMRRTVKALGRKSVRARVERAMQQKPVELEGMLSNVAPEHIASVFRMFAEMQYGELRPGAYSADDWERFRDAVVGELGPDAVDERQPVASVEALALQRSQQVSFRALIAGLKRASDVELCVCRNELQELHTLTAIQAGQAPGLITRDAFRHYFAERMVDTDRAPLVVETLRALGWVRPPASPLETLIASLQQTRSIDATE